MATSVIQIPKNTWTLLSSVSIEYQILGQNSAYIREALALPTDLSIRKTVAPGGVNVFNKIDSDLYIYSPNANISVALSPINKTDIKTAKERWEEAGFCFQYNQIITLPDTGTADKYFLFNPTGVPDNYRIYVAPLELINVEDGPVVVNYYFGSNYTGGTPLLLLNRNGESAITPNTVVTENPTGTVKGTKTSANKVAKGGALPSQSGGGDSGLKTAFITSNQLPILIEGVNTSGASVTAEVFFEFCEVPRDQI